MKTSLLAAFLVGSLLAGTVTEPSKQVIQYAGMKISGIFEVRTAEHAALTNRFQNAALFENDICLPATLYMLTEVQNDIFVEPLIKRWRPYNDVVRFSGTVKYLRRLQRVASIQDPGEGATVTLDLINEDRFDTLKTITSTIVVGERGTGTDSIFFSIIGDSFTNGAFFRDALLERGYVPKIKMVGLRNVTGCPGQFDEGRGGWTLASYFKISRDTVQSYNGFWQPEGNYRYWGATQFWKLANAVRINPEGDWTFHEKYFGGRFETRSLWYDARTGYKVNPEKNDLMFDNNLGYFVLFNGRKWIRAEYDDFAWSFSYGKYLSMWKLKSPSILAEFLGLNDFRDAPDPGKIDFTVWNARMERLIISYKKAVPEGKFVLMIPSSTCGILDNTAGDFTTKQNACMWEVRKNIIKNFDKREAENIYIVDAAVAIDDLNGFRYTTDSVYTKPYSAYAGVERIAVQTGNPHPYLNYPAMGISLAAFIQKYR